MRTRAYFSHVIDSETLYCVKCGRSLVTLQEERRWDGNEVLPACYEAENVVGISHLARLPGDAAVPNRPRRRSLR